MPTAAPPTLPLAVMAVMSEPSDFVANAIFPTTNAPGGVLLPGERIMRATGYRMRKEDVRKGAEGRSLRSIPGQKPKRVQMGVESYNIVAPAYEVEAEVDTLGEKINAGLGNIGLTDVEQYAAEQLGQALLIDQEQRLNGLLVPANFNTAANLTGSSDGFWSNDTTDPIVQLQDVALTLIRAAGMAAGNILQLVFSAEDWNAFRNNAKVRARFGDGIAPQEVDPFVKLIGSAIFSGSGRNLPVDIRVAYATAVGGVAGDPDDADFIISGKSCMTISLPGDGVGRTDNLRRRAYGKGYVGTEPIITPYDEGAHSRVYNCIHARGLEIFDQSAGALFTGMTES